MRLETARLLIEPLRMDDAAVLFGYRGDAVVARYQGWWPAAPEEVERFIARQAAVGPGEWFQRAIRRRSDGCLLGDLGVCLPVDPDAAAEFGVTIAPAHQRQGVAREAVLALLQWLLVDQGRYRVVASLDPRNEASRALLSGVGMRQEAHFRQSLVLRGERVDDLVFALLADEWRARRDPAAGARSR